MQFQEGFFIVNCVILPVEEECEKFIRLVLCLLMLTMYKMQQTSNSNNETKIAFVELEMCATTDEREKNKIKKNAVKCPSSKIEKNELNNKGWRKKLCQRSLQ